MIKFRVNEYKYHKLALLPILPECNEFLELLLEVRVLFKSE